MPSQQRVQNLISYVEQGKIIEAINEFYAEDVTMQENNEPPRVGFDANLKHENEFVASVAEVHENRAVSFIVDGDRSAIAWVFDFTDKAGNRYRFDQVAYQRWQGDRIVQERFYYDAAGLRV